MDMFTSCLILPSPLATRLVVLKSLPKVRAIFNISLGVPVTGSRAISINGIPSLSSPYSLNFPSSNNNFPESSSKQIVCIPIFFHQPVNDHHKKLTLFFEIQRYLIR